ncbi:MAG: SpoVR family protein [Deltaproteobacteria bacterium]|nr:SpoVR family protein [Deltaproteobacteria bacterium]
MPSRFVSRGRDLPAELEQERARIAEIAAGHGLDPFETIFLMCTADEINMLAAYDGFPVRYPHWRWGMAYLQMQKGYEYGLQKIYEMVINTDPSYAYLLDNNMVVDQKLVMAHVFGHVDFFKNNVWFSQTNRKMLDTMANHAARIQRHMDRHGQAEVEAFIDRVCSLDNLIDTHAALVRRAPEKGRRSALQPDAEPAPVEVTRIPTRPYMERHVNPPAALQAERARKEADLAAMQRVPERPERDILGLLLEHAPLERWQRDVVAIVREEALYFAPQVQTKIMNEGWATYWHTHLMTREILADDEVIDYCDHHSGTTATRPGQLNPYKLGVELWRHIERRWDRGQFGRDWAAIEDPAERARIDTGAGLGREKLFEVRASHNDVTFLDDFLDADFCAEQGLFTTQRDQRTGKYIIDSRELRDVKRGLLSSLASKGNPRIYAVDANLHNRGELRLVHRHDGLDVQLDWAETALGNLAALWGRPVELETLVDDAAIVLRHDGQTLERHDVDADAEARAEEARR